MKIRAILKRSIALLLVASFLFSNALTSLANASAIFVVKDDVSVVAETDDAEDINKLVEDKLEEVVVSEDDTISDKVVCEVEGSESISMLEEEVEEEYVTISFESKYGVCPEDIQVKKGGKVSELPSPQYEYDFYKSGKYFVGWHYTPAPDERTTVWPMFVKSNPIEEDLTLYAEWIYRVYSEDVKLNLEGGEFVDGYEAVTHKKSEDVISLPTADDVKKEGYKFAGWLDRVPFTSMNRLANNLNKEYYDVFDAAFITYKNSLFTEFSPETTTHLEVVRDVEKVVDGEEYNIIHNYHADLYAVWLPIGEDETETIVDETETTVDETETTVDETETETAVEETVEPEEVTVTFVTEIGVAPEPITVKKGEFITVDVKPEYEEYFDRTTKNFNYWHTEGSDTMWCYKTDAITENTTLYASWYDWVVNNKIVYNLNDGEFVKGFNPVEKREYGEVITLPSKDKIVKTKHKFLGWKLNNKFITSIDDKTEKQFVNYNGTDDAKYYHVENYETVVTAEWELIEDVNIVFNTNGGTTIQNKIIDAGTVIPQIADPKKEGYQFEYWYTDNASQKFDTKQKVYKDTKLNAKWKKNKYSVTYQLNGGSFAKNYKAVNTVEYKTATTLPAAANITKKGYTFNGWYTNSNLKVQNKITSLSATKNTTLYAGWTENSYTITYDYGKYNSISRVYQSYKPTFTYGSENKLYIYNKNAFVSTRKYTGEVTLPNANHLEVTDAIFAGWKISGTNTVVTKISKNTATNIKVVAQWTTRQRYVKDIKATYSTNQSLAKSMLKHAGYEVISVNLNKGCKKKNNPYVYVGVQYTYNSKQALTDIKGINQTKKCKDHIKYFGALISYKAVCAPNATKPIDFNEAAGGRYVYMYTTKNSRAGSPIKEIDVKAFEHYNGSIDYEVSSGYKPVANTSDGRKTDFNHGAGGDYIYVYYKK